MRALVENDSKAYRADYYSDDGGLLLISRARIAEVEMNGNERKKFAKEWSMSKTLACDAHQVLYRESVEGEFDIYVDGVAADLKQLKSGNNVVNKASYAVNHKGTDYVIFEFTCPIDTKIRLKIEELHHKGFHGYYWSSQDYVIHNI